MNIKAIEMRIAMVADNANDLPTPELFELWSALREAAEKIADEIAWRHINKPAPSDAPWKLLSLRIPRIPHSFGEDI